MFNRLPESNRKRQRRSGGFFASTVVHLVVIAFAVKASGLTAAPAPKTEVLKPTVYIEQRDPTPTPPQPLTRRTSTSSDAVIDQLPPTVPPVITLDIPETIPESGAGLDLQRAFETRGTVSTFGRSDGPPNVSGDSAFLKEQVEKAVVALPGTAGPRYPGMLQGAGVEGDVRAQFVVDTLGRVEQGSFKVLASTHDLFAQAVKDALTRARFQPAEVGGRHVRQLVEQSFTFRITK